MIKTAAQIYTFAQWAETMSETLKSITTNCTKQGKNQRRLSFCAGKSWLRSLKNSTMDSKFDDLKQATQNVIDQMSEKKFQAAIHALSQADELLEHLIDHSTSDNDIRELGRFQVLLDTLRTKIHSS